MKKNYYRKAVLLLPILLVITSISCASNKPLYDWYDYQEDSYHYLKNADEKSVKTLIETYEKIISKQNASRAAVPPGIYADYGYLLIRSGKTKEGTEMLKKEVELYPESEVFVSQIIKRLGKK
ncbi:DUF4810 domain-containing protein [Treponema parvum]|uniref:DUF4810 domain-containing protein n=1 Tax=Treponema parvum TaxID=138851 RepID=A0A975F5V9_9SPIR|nr:DUF4810 domain-containing protein [Treponema parvum]QTQ14920.1 DUF4810 domain-containing protein [Treponema parvum]